MFSDVQSINDRITLCSSIKHNNYHGPRALMEHSYTSGKFAHESGKYAHKSGKFVNNSRIFPLYYFECSVISLKNTKICNSTSNCYSLAPDHHRFILIDGKGV